MCDRSADILVEVERCDARPVNPRLLDELINHLKLRGPGGYDDIGFSVFLDGFADELGS